MRALTLALSLMLGPTPLFAQGPFQFREASLLENRIEFEQSGKEYDPSHSEEGASRTVTCMVNCPDSEGQYVSPRENLRTYNSIRWVDLLLETDRFRRMGGFDLAEKQYIEMTGMLRKAQGPSTSDVALMLDHLGEFYLEERNFARAYDTFSEALRVRRSTIDALTRAQEKAGSDPQALARETLYTMYGVMNSGADARVVCRLHLADLLTRLGELDLAKGELDGAKEKLAEAVAISNETGYRRYANGLYAIYFLSLVLERQSKWQEAEKLWKDAVKLREPMNLSAPYWDSMKEMAAFYARRGDFHTGADIAQSIDLGALRKPALAMPFLINSRPWSGIYTGSYDVYTLASNTAMSEILAVDKWYSDGAEAATALLTNPFVSPNSSMLDRGSDSERAQLLAWFEQVAFLHMSILLDGEPSQDRINKAYELLSVVKGRYLASITETNRLVESWRGNPNVQSSELPTLDQLTEARERHAHMFIATALEGQPFSGLQFAASENTQRVLTEALSSGNSTTNSGVHSPFSLDALRSSVPDDATFIDIVVWERSSRRGQIPPHREYGAFVVRKGQPVRYVSIGPVEGVDSDIDALEAGVVGNHIRGFHANEQNQTIKTEEVQQRLKSLYKKVIAPLESLLAPGSKVLIVPDGKLTLAPIAAFMDGQGHYFMERYTVNYLSSWRDLVDPYDLAQDKTSPPVIVANPDFDVTFEGPANTPTNSQRLVFAPLPGAEGEAEDVQKALRVPQARVLIGKMARKRLIQSLGVPEVLHFATHSVPNLQWKAPVPAYSFFEFPQALATEDPLLQSVIALAGANRSQAGTEDGLLTGLEVASLRLAGTRLVVLSSCDSGKGTPVDGQGVLGLRAAFSMAGAEALVMTLWAVDDQAGRQFMQFFYSHIGKGPAEAVRLAQVDLLTKTQYKDPYYWAGYAVSGHSRPVNVEHEKSEAGTAAKGESFLTPKCFELSTHNSQVPWMHLNTIRIRIGGVVRRSQNFPDQAIYDIHAPGNDLEIRHHVSVNGVPVKGSTEVTQASQLDWSVTLTVEKQKDYSGIYIEFGPNGAAQERITLRGGPDLMPSLDIPDWLPPLSSYTEATDSRGRLGNAVATIDTIGSCGVDPLQ